jgi:hypothetical protein
VINRNVQLHHARLVGQAHGSDAYLLIVAVARAVSLLARFGLGSNEMISASGTNSRIDSID